MSEKETKLPRADGGSADGQQLSAGSVRVLVEGRVQGVGFRWFTRRVAKELGVLGWVRNLPDGRVEACAAGDEEALHRFVERLRDGPRGGRVQKMEVRELADARELGEFEIRG